MSFEQSKYPFGAAVRLGTKCSGSLVGFVDGVPTAEAKVVDYWLGGFSEKSKCSPKSDKIMAHVNDWALLIIDEDLGNQFGYFDLGGGNGGLLAVGFPRRYFVSPNPDNPKQKKSYWAQKYGMAEPRCGYSFGASKKPQVRGLHKTSCQFSGRSSGGPLLKCKKAGRSKYPEGYSKCRVSAIAARVFTSTDNKIIYYVKRISTDMKNALETLRRLEKI